MLKNNNENHVVHGCVSNGLCQLLIYDVLDEKESECVLRTALDTIKSSNEFEATNALILVVTAIYVGEFFFHFEAATLLLKSSREIL